MADWLDTTSFSSTGVVAPSPAGASIDFRTHTGFVANVLRGINMTELSGFIVTPEGPVPAIGGSEGDYRSTWPFTGKPVYELIRARRPRRGLVFDTSRPLDMRKWRLFAIDFGHDFPEELTQVRVAYFYDRTHDWSKLPPPSESGPLVDYRFLEVFEQESFLGARRTKVSFFSIQRNFRGFPELWNSMKAYPWVYDVPLHKPVARSGLVSTPYGNVPAVCGSSDDYHGIPWPFQHRGIPGYGTLYPGAQGAGRCGSQPVTELLEPMDLSLWTPIAINFGSVYDLPVALFWREGDFRRVTIEHGERYKGPFWMSEPLSYTIDYLAHYFSHTSLWPELSAANEWLRPYIPNLIRRGFVSPDRWYSANGPQEDDTKGSDGPAIPYSWKADGNVVADRMKPTAWRLVNYLWAQPNRVSAYDHGLAAEVFQDHAVSVDKVRVGSHRRDANNFFKKHSIAWRVTAKRDVVELIPERPD